MTPQNFSRRKFIKLLHVSVVLFFILTAPAPLVFAHADLETRIEAVSRSLATAPTANLFMKRGNLHQQHGDWTSAQADYLKARELAPSLAEIDYYLGTLHLRSGNPEQAETFLRRFVAARPHLGHARFQLGRALVRQDRIKEGAALMGEALASLPAPKPEHYIERARALADASPHNEESAIASLDEGIARMGPVVALVEMAADLEAERGNYNAGISRIETLPAPLKTSPAWLLRKGELHWAAEDWAKARIAFESATRAIDRLPPRRKATAAFQQLRARLMLLLARSKPSE